jgi:ADP-heptose:LPS heptosyltransferase
MVNKNEPRTIKVCAGIGDSIWLMQKLINSNEKFHFQLPDGSPQRGKPLFDLLPQVAESASYIPGMSYTKIAAENIQAKKSKWVQIKDREFFLTANRHLENGNRIEEFLPDLPTSFRIGYATTEANASAAEKLLYDKSKRYIGIYTTAYSNARNAGGWIMLQWFKLIRLLQTKNRDICFVIVGASYDVGITDELVKELNMAGIMNINTTGQPLPVVIELLKRFSYFIGFPSGLSIINETLGKDGVMFYTEKDKGIINTWAEPGRIKAGYIKECLFCDPPIIYDWIVNEYNLIDKL